MQRRQNDKFLMPARSSLRSGVCAAVTLVSACTLLSVSAQAQVPPAQTGIASPGRVEEQIQPPKFLQRNVPNIEVRELEIKEAPPGAENVTLTLNHVNITGMTIYSDAQARDVYGDKIGKEITLVDVYAIAADLTRKYREDGYILTQVIVPPQTIENGEVTLRVVEGFIDQINVQGGDESSTSVNQVYGYISHLKGKSAVNSADLERALLLVNDLPGMTARAILSPSADRTGGANLDVILERDWIIGEVGLDNYGTKFLGPLQASASAALNSVLGMNERITGQAVWGVGPANHRKELAYGSILYDQPVGSYGTVISLFGSYTNTEPGFTLRQFDVHGYGRRFYAQVSQPFIRSRAFNLKGYGTFDYNDVTSTNNLIGVPTLDDKIRALRAGTKIDALDTLFGVAYNDLNIEYSHGLSTFGANSESDTNVSRPGAGGNFDKLELTGTRLQRLSSSFNLLLGVTGQMADGGLLSSEEFGLGGSQWGRGYDPSEVTGDEGFAGTVELQWNNPMTFSEDIDTQLYTFFDAGRVFNEDATSSKLKNDALSSAGLGFRTTFMGDTSAGGMVAVPLNREPQTQNDQGPRFFFNVSHTF